MRTIRRKWRRRRKCLFYISLVIQIVIFLYLVRLIPSSAFKSNEFHTFAEHTFNKSASSELIVYPTTAENTTEKTTVYPTTAVKTTKGPVIDMVNDYYPFVDFKFVFPHIMPEFQQMQAFFLIVLVNSGAKGDEFRRRRVAIRETWGSHKSCEQSRTSKDPKFRDLQWILVFVVGKAGPGTTDDERNAEEAKQHNDMLIGSIDDNYLNNIVKFYMGQLWASTLRPKYILKTDDDVYVRIPGVIRYLVKKNFPKPFYGGKTNNGFVVPRKIGDKWSISKKYFDQAVWPPFNAGAFFILSTDLLNKLFHYVHRRKPFHTDDAYVGVAMKDFNVKVTDIPWFDVKSDMPEFIRQKNDCETLALIAFGHKVDPDSSKILYGRLESICRNGITMISC